MDFLRNPQFAAQNSLKSIDFSKEKDVLVFTFRSTKVNNDIHIFVNPNTSFDITTFRLPPKPVPAFVMEKDEDDADEYDDGDDDGNDDDDPALQDPAPQDQKSTVVGPPTPAPEQTIAYQLTEQFFSTATKNAVALPKLKPVGQPVFGETVTANAKVLGQLPSIQTSTPYTVVDSENAIGSGSNSNIFSVCVPPNASQEKCIDWVIKYTTVDTAYPDTIDSFSRDLYFLILLQATKLVPVLHRYGIIKDEKGKHIAGGEMILQRFDGDMGTLGKSRAIMHLSDYNAHRNARLFKVGEVVAMYKMCVKLGQYEITHGDLKPDQFLYKIAKDQISITDFEFTGKPDSPFPCAKSGWMNDKLGCPAGFQPLNPCTDSKTCLCSPELRVRYAIFMNLMQLESYMLIHNDVYFLPDNATSNTQYTVAQLTRFGGFESYNRDQNFPVCQKYNNAWWVQQNTFIKQESKKMAYIRAMPLLS